jgi:hypothetical protein
LSCAESGIFFVFNFITLKIFLASMIYFLIIVIVNKKCFHVVVVVIQRSATCCEPKKCFVSLLNVAHNLCNSNNTAPSICIIRVTIYAANGKVGHIHRRMC